MPQAPDSYQILKEQNNSMQHLIQKKQFVKRFKIENKENLQFAKSKTLLKRVDLVGRAFQNWKNRIGPSWRFSRRGSDCADSIEERSWRGRKQNKNSWRSSQVARSLNGNDDHKAIRVRSYCDHRGDLIVIVWGSNSEHFSKPLEVLGKLEAHWKLPGKRLDKTTSESFSIVKERQTAVSAAPTQTVRTFRGFRQASS